MNSKRLDQLSGALGGASLGATSVAALTLVGGVVAPGLGAAVGAVIGAVAGVAMSERASTPRPPAGGTESDSLLEDDALPAQRDKAALTGHSA